MVQPKSMLIQPKIKREAEKTRENEGRKQKKTRQNKTEKKKTRAKKGKKARKNKKNKIEKMKTRVKKGNKARKNQSKSRQSGPPRCRGVV